MYTYIYIFTQKRGNLKENESQLIEMKDPGNTKCQMEETLVKL